MQFFTFLSHMTAYTGLTRDSPLFMTPDLDILNENTYDLTIRLTTNTLKTIFIY